MAFNLTKTNNFLVNSNSAFFKNFAFLTKKDPTMPSKSSRASSHVFRSHVFGGHFEKTLKEQRAGDRITDVFAACFEKAPKLTLETAWDPCS